jgi:hypothetical protein
VVVALADNPDRELLGKVFQADMGPAAAAAAAVLVVLASPPQPT